MSDKNKAKKEGKKGAGNPQKPAKATPSICKVGGCKSNPSKFGFCSGHFDQFKFGLINKHGENVPDYDKKIEHWNHFQETKKAA